jgi:hypothetical protein
MPDRASAKRPPLSQAIVVLAAIGMAGAITTHIFSEPRMKVKLDRVELLAARTQPGITAHSTVHRVGEAEDVLFVLPELSIANPRSKPISFETAELVFTTQAGAKATVHQPTSDKLALFEGEYPALAPPIAYNTRTLPGQSTQGHLLFQLNMPESVWAARKAATIQINFDHAPPISIAVP